MKISLLITVLFLSTVLSADWDNEQKLIASDGAAYDYFGNSISIDGDYAVIGAFKDGDNWSMSGSAYIFLRSGTNWTEQTKIAASDGGIEDYFGYSVSISGDYAVIGAYGDDENGAESGSAYVFYRSGSTWTEQIKLTASDGSADDRFGCSVAISGDYVVIGAWGDDDNGVESGSAYIFHRSGTNWTQQIKLTALDGTAEDWFGYSVSISGDYAVIGARYDDDNGAESGSAYIFHRSGTSWTQQIKLTALDAAAYDWFGYSVSISGDYAVIGSPWDDDNGVNSGSTYIFYRSGTNWAEQVKLTASDGTADDEFGRSVSIDGDYTVIGACHDDDDGTDSGSAYIFHRNGTSWTQQAKITATDGADFDYFGCPVSISGDYAVIAANYDDDNGADSGSAYIYHNSGVSVSDNLQSSIFNTQLSNYPNPFNPSTTISFSIRSEQYEQVELGIYNIKGQKMKTFLINSSTDQPINSIIWNGTDNKNKPVSSGMYFYKLKTANFEKTKKMILIK